MRVVLQRVRTAEVAIGDRVAARIGPGLLVLLGIHHDDTEGDAAWLASRLARLRILADDAGQMNRSVVDAAGDVLVVSQFTLFASTRKGNRPSFHDAARPEVARPLYEAFLRELAAATTRPPATGEFGADMQVTLTNDGPVTLVLDSRLRE